MKGSCDPSFFVCFLSPSLGHMRWRHDSCSHDNHCMQILAGRTPLAKAAARGTLSKQGPLHDAAGYDLDVLQRLSLAESTFAGETLGLLVQCVTRCLSVLSFCCV